MLSLIVETYTHHYCRCLLVQGHCAPVHMPNIHSYHKVLGRMRMKATIGNSN
jgi:hypothetical protein